MRRGEQNRRAAQRKNQRDQSGGGAEANGHRGGGHGAFVGATPFGTPALEDRPGMYADPTQIPARSRLSGKGQAQMQSVTRTANEDPAHVGRGLTDFSRTAVFTMKGHASSAARRAQGKRDNQQAGRTPRLPKHLDR